MKLLFGESYKLKLIAKNPNDYQNLSNPGKEDRRTMVWTELNERLAALKVKVCAAVFTDGLYLCTDTPNHDTYSKVAFLEQAIIEEDDKGLNGVKGSFKACRELSVELEQVVRDGYREGSEEIPVEFDMCGRPTWPVRILNMDAIMGNLDRLG